MHRSTKRNAQSLIGYKVTSTLLMSEALKSALCRLGIRVANSQCPQITTLAFVTTWRCTYGGLFFTLLTQLVNCLSRFHRPNYVWSQCLVWWFNLFPKGIDWSSRWQDEQSISNILYYTCRFGWITMAMWVIVVEIMGECLVISAIMSDISQR